MKNIVYTIMKKNIFIITICCIIAGMTCSMQANAQARPDSVSVHAGQKPLVELLTDEQKETIKYLTVTGKLLDEDYKYIRESLIVKLKELNLRDADIDTIPEKAFKCNESCDKSNLLDNLLLPQKIAHISDGAFFEQQIRNFIITGNFPTLGNNVFREEPYNNYMPQISKDNHNLKIQNGFIYSFDGSILYYYYITDNDLDDLTYPNKKLKTISANAFEGLPIHRMTIPETVDSIGNRAFAYVSKEWYTGVQSGDESVNCCALVPPRLGQNVFLNSDLIRCTMYVPEESLELYKAADGWKDLHLEGKTFPTNNIINTKDYMFKIFNNGISYQISASKSIKAIEIYDVKGRLTNEVKVNRKEVSISKATLAKPYAIVKLTFGDDTYRIIKLIP